MGSYGLGSFSASWHYFVLDLSVNNLLITVGLGIFLYYVFRWVSPSSTPSKLIIVHHSQPAQPVSYVGWGGDNDLPSLIPETSSSTSTEQEKGLDIYDLIQNCDCFNGSLPFVPAYGFSNPHVQTMFGPTNISPGPEVKYQREEFQLADGGRLSLDWYPSAPSSSTSSPVSNPAPIVLILHGMGGGSHASYAKELVHQLLYPERVLDEPCRSVVFNHRGCGNTEITTPRLYTAGDTSDLKQVIDHLNKLYPAAPLIGIGFSIGGNILTKYLGEVGTETSLIAAATISNPYNLVWCSRNMQRNWVNRNLYTPFLLRMLKKLFRSHTLLASAIPEREWTDISDFEMDITILNPHLTAPNKFVTLNDYYRQSSCDRYIHNVKIPCLFLNALDDPVSPVAAIAVDEIHYNPNCLLAATYQGGHTGWWWNPHSIDPRQASSWATQALAQYIRAVLKSHPLYDSPIILNPRETSP